MHQIEGSVTINLNAHVFKQTSQVTSFKFNKIIIVIKISNITKNILHNSIK